MRLRWKLGTVLFSAVAVIGSGFGATASSATPAQSAAVASSTRVGECQFVGSMHLSNGYHLNPTVSSSGAFDLNSTVAACNGALGSLVANGTYNDPISYNGIIGAAGCYGTMSGARGGALFVATLSGMGCGSTTNGAGVLVAWVTPDPLTLNTCGGSTTDQTVCDLFVYGTLTFTSS